jgi:hypothetical protein
MYTNGVCDSDNLINSYLIDEDFNEGLISYDADTFWNNFDADKFKAVILERATDFITDNVKPLLKSLYNFGLITLERRGNNVMIIPTPKLIKTPLNKII